MTAEAIISAARVTHEDATVDDLAAAAPESVRDGVVELLAAPCVEEAFVLSTCNRVEAYVVTGEPDSGETALSSFFEPVADVAVRTGHDESLEHLLRVACGLESVVVGEDQILGQIRSAYEDARAVGAIGEFLDPAVTKAIHVGERARTETEINEGIVSLGSAAVELVADDRSLEGATALVVGAGEMGRLAAHSLADAAVAEVVVANRTVARAAELAADVDGDARAVGLESLETAAARADVVVAATGSDEPVLTPAHLGEGEQVVVDLGQPRDVAPAVDELASVTVYDLDDLESITAATRERRADAAGEVEAMIDREFALLCEQYKRARADEVIAAMYESAERIKRRELETAFGRLDDDLSADQREVVESLADALVGQLLAAPTKSLREAAAEDDWTTIHTALQLFDPDLEEAAIPAPAGAETATETYATDDD